MGSRAVSAISRKSARPAPIAFWWTSWRPAFAPMTLKRRLSSLLPTASPNPPTPPSADASRNSSPPSPSAPSNTKAHAEDSMDELPPALRQHLFDRLEDRKIAVDDLYRLKLWRESEPEAPDGLWYNPLITRRACRNPFSVPPGRSCFVKKTVVVRCNKTPFNVDFLPFAAFRFGKPNFGCKIERDCLPNPGFGGFSADFLPRPPSSSRTSQLANLSAPLFS